MLRPLELGKPGRLDSLETKASDICYIQKQWRNLSKPRLLVSLKSCMLSQPVKRMGYSKTLSLQSATARLPYSLPTIKRHSHLPEYIVLLQYTAPAKVRLIFPKLKTIRTSKLEMPSPSGFQEMFAAQKKTTIVTLTRFLLGALQYHFLHDLNSPKHRPSSSLQN